MAKQSSYCSCTTVCHLQAIFLSQIHLTNHRKKHMTLPPHGKGSLILPMMRSLGLVRGEFFCIFKLRASNHKISMEMALPILNTEFNYFQGMWSLSTNHSYLCLAAARLATPSHVLCGGSPSRRLTSPRAATCLGSPWRGMRPRTPYLCL